jgi:glycosyltransferase involved in cell wall biosynthesis
MPPVRIAYLQKAPSGHMNACLRALAERDVELLVTLPPTLREAPHDLAIEDWIDRPVPIESWHDTGSVWTELDLFDPDVVLIVSWDKPVYRACARRLRGRAVRVLCMDNQWLGTPKQWLGVLTSRAFLHPCFDRAFMPGRRQERFARRLGFAENQIDLGFYSADVQLFSRPNLSNDGGGPFLFAGRLVDEKGITDLIAAYGRYRETVDSPRDLIVAGTGPLAGQLAACDGVRLVGFVTSEQLASLMGECSAFVLPSRFEPWGVVIHEAVCAGLAVLTTDCVGAADVFVENHVNGHVGRTGSVDDLVEGMVWWHELAMDARHRAEIVSRRLAAAFSPSTWADTVMAMAQHRPRTGELS